jgi:TonB family protein
MKNCRRGLRAFIILISLFAFSAVESSPEATGSLQMSPRRVSLFRQRDYTERTARLMNSGQAFQPGTDMDCFQRDPTVIRLAKSDNDRAQHWDEIFSRYDKEKDYEQMVHFFQKVSEQQPDSVAVHRYLLYGYLRLNNSEGALNELEKLISLQPKERKYLSQAANLYQKEGRCEEAMKKIEQLLKIDPADRESKQDYQRLSSECVGRSTVSQPAYRKQSEAKKEAGVFYEEGNGHFEAGNYEKAIASYSKAIIHEQNFAPLYYNLAIAQMIVGKDQEAKENFIKYLKLRPNAANANEVKDYLKSIDSPSTDPDLRKPVQTAGPMPGGQAGLARRIYYTEVWNAIRSKWTPPDSSKDKNLEAVLIVTVRRDGKILNVRFEQRSGNAVFDQSAERAIMKADPLPPFPELYSPLQEEIGVRIRRE